MGRVNKNKTVFQQRLADTVKNSRTYTMQKLSEELNITVTNWMKSGANLPKLDDIKKVAKLLNVDVGYLLGEQDTKTLTSAKLSELTSLSVNACKCLEDMKINYPNASVSDTLSEIIENEKFERLLLEIYFYSTSHNQQISIHDNANIYNDRKIASPEMVKVIMQESCLKIFSEILDDIYAAHSKEQSDLMEYQILKELLEKAKESDIYSAPEIRKTYLAYMQNLRADLLRINYHSTIARMSIDDIIANADKLYNALIH